MSLRGLSLCLLLSAAAGCAVGPDYKPPKVSTPAAWQEPLMTPSGTGGASLERWWASFHDPVLDGLVTRAVAGNLDLRIAAARIREARAAGGIAASGALPQVSAGAAYARGRRSDAVPPFSSATGEGSPFGPRDQDVFEAGFDMSWEIDVFGRVRREREAAVADVAAAEEARRDVLVTLLADVARNYVELRGVQRQLQILDDTLRSQATTLDLATARFEAGLATDLDRARAQGLLASTRAERPSLERAASRAIHRLGVLLGREPGSLFDELSPRAAIPLAPPEVPPFLPSELLSRRPDLRRAERELAAATARIGVATADLYPRFSIAGRIGALGTNASDLVHGAAQLASIVPGVSWPIFSGGRIRANIRVEDARQEQALGRYDKAVLGALEEVENGLVAQSRARRREEDLRDSLAQNRRALDLATERYTGGLESFLSVLDAQRVVYASDDQLARSETDEAVTLIALYKALGGGWSLAD